jgi:iron complex transport system ATP-binding protein
MVELRVSSISFRYDSAPALDNVEFSVRSHEFVGILGPNGSGKTTLLRTVSRVLRPTLGVVLVDEKDVYSLSPVDAARKIAVVPQDSSVHFNFAALEIVMMGRNPHLGPFEMESRQDLAVAKRAMKLTKCEHLANRRVNELSGGEKRRVIIARALAQEPRILLLDEPTLNLDVNNQIELMETVKKLCREEGIAALSVFHDFNLAARYSDRLLLLNDGRVYSLGTPETVLTQENLEKVFRVNAEITRHPVTRLNVTILSAVSSESRDDAEHGAASLSSPIGLQT